MGINSAGSLEGLNSAFVDGTAEGSETLKISFDAPASNIQVVLADLDSAETVEFVAYGYDEAGNLVEIGSGLLALDGTEVDPSGTSSFALDLVGVAVLELTALTATTFSLESISADLEPAISMETTPTVDEEATTEILATSTLDTTDAALLAEESDTSSDTTVDEELAADLVTDMDSSETSLDGLLADDSTTTDTTDVSSLEDTSTTDATTSDDASMTTETGGSASISDTTTAVFDGDTTVAA